MSIVKILFRTAGVSCSFSKHLGYTHMIRTLIFFIALFGALQVNGQTKEYNKLEKIYLKKNDDKLIKQAKKIHSKNLRDSAPYYFMSLAYFNKYTDQNIESYFNRAISNLKKAKKLDKSKSNWLRLSDEITSFKEKLAAKTSQLATSNKSASRKLCASYIVLFADTLECYSALYDIVKKEPDNASSLAPFLLEQAQNKRDSIVAIGATLVGIPYKWAGETTAGFDCSGFVQYVYKKVGIKLPHNANKISYLGTEVNEKDAQPGDIILFGTRKGKEHRAYHAGIIYENKNGQIRVIHCVSKGVNISTNYDSYWKSRAMMITNVMDPYLTGKLASGVESKK
jgi:cell wall-associated NlpC family hydrolase